MPRHYRRNSRPRIIQKTYKKVLNFAPTSHGAGVQVDNILVQGVDSVSPNQGSPTDPIVPTGSIITSFTIMYSAVNLAAAANFSHWVIQYTIGSQSLFVPCNLIGGNNQRNQVMKSGMSSMGEQQNYNVKLNFKIPKMFQRVKEGMFWTFSVLGTAAYTDSLQVIYKIRS